MFFYLKNRFHHLIKVSISAISTTKKDLSMCHVDFNGNQTNKDYCNPHLLYSCPDLSSHYGKYPDSCK